MIILKLRLGQTRTPLQFVFPLLSSTGQESTTKKASCCCQWQLGQVDRGIGVWWEANRVYIVGFTPEKLHIWQNLQKGAHVFVLSFGSPHSQQPSLMWDAVTIALWQMAAALHIAHVHWTSGGVCCSWRRPPERGNCKIICVCSPCAPAEARQWIFLIFRREFGNFSGKFGGNFPGIFLTHRTKAQTFRGKFRSIFRKKIRGSKKIFRAKFTLQTCHLKCMCFSEQEHATCGY